MQVECINLSPSIAQVSHLGPSGVPPQSAERWSPATARTHRLRSVVPKTPVELVGFGRGASILSGF